MRSINERIYYLRPYLSIPDDPSLQYWLLLPIKYVSSLVQILYDSVSMKNASFKSKFKLGMMLTVPLKIVVKEG